MEPAIIEGISCYAPHLALENSGYHPDALKTLSNIEKKNFWYVSRNIVLKTLFKKFLKENKCEVLEVGCGNGVVLSALSELKNLQLTGADIYLSGVKFAKSEVPQIDFIQMDALNIPFEKKFGAVGCFDVLEHIEEDERVITQLYKALKNNSYLFISVPQYPWLWSEIDEIDRHKRRYTKRELVIKIKKAGFNIVYTNSFAFAVFPITLLSRLSRKRNKKNESTIDYVKYPEIDISPALNFMLRTLMRIDEWCYELNIKLPFGSSIILVAKKN